MLVETFGIDSVPGAKQALAFVSGTIDGWKTLQDIVGLMESFFGFAFENDRSDGANVANAARQLGDVTVVNGTNVSLKIK